MGCAEGIVKLLVFGVNLIFALAGLVLIVVGVLYKLDINNYTDAVPAEYQNIGLAPILTIIVGSVIFLIAFFGCCGAIRESPCLLTAYAIILLVIFIMQIAVGVFAFLEIKDEDALQTQVKRTLSTIFNSYYNNNRSKEIVDLIQQEFECCGLEDKSSWGTLNPMNPIPVTCYKDQINKKDIFENGCIDEFFDFLKDSVKVIGITVLAMSGIEVVGSIFSLCLASSIRNRERRFRY